jgi:hypothetical protein
VKYPAAELRGIQFSKKLFLPLVEDPAEMNYPAASSGVSKTTTGKILRPKGRGIHPDGIKGLVISFSE